MANATRQNVTEAVVAAVARVAAHMATPTPLLRGTNGSAAAAPHEQHLNWSDDRNVVYWILGGAAVLGLLCSMVCISLQLHMRVSEIQEEMEDLRRMDFMESGSSPSPTGFSVLRRNESAPALLKATGKDEAEASIEVRPFLFGLDHYFKPSPSILRRRVKTPTSKDN